MLDRFRHSLRSNRDCSFLAGLVLTACLTGGCRPAENATSDANRSSDVSVDDSGREAGGERLFQAIPRDRSATVPAAPKTAVSRPRLVDVAQRSGLDFVYRTGAAGESLMVETMGGGCGVLDFDNDGWWDLFLCQGGDPTVADPTRQPLPALMRNLAGESFEDCGESSVGASSGYSQGVAIGDYDGDGFDDVYITNVGKNQLLRNMGDGSFQDVTDLAGVGDTRWSSSAAFADLNGNGLLDLYVCNYVVYDPLDPLDCRDRDGEYRICHPREMDAFPNECYFNQGDGTFLPEAADRGLDAAGGKSLGVVVADFTGNGLPDVFVANDTTANFLFVNQGQGLFREQALAFGCGVNQEGMYEAGMGLAVADYDQDGFLDIYSTHFYEESNTLYQNQGGKGFRDVTALVGLHQPTLPRLGFGAVMQDLNADGIIDLFVTNGHIENYPGNPLHAMRPQLFTYTGPRWDDCSDDGGEFFRRRSVGRGVAMVDTSRRGVPDIVVVHQDSPAALLRGESIDGDWLQVEFRGGGGNRRGIGAGVRVTRGAQKLYQQLVGGGSYASSHQPTLFFGLGDTTDGIDIAKRGDTAERCNVEVTWPSGKSERLEGVAVNSLLVLDERDAN